MTDEQRRVIDSFCKYAGLENRFDAEVPNAICGLEPFFNYKEIEGWDPVDDYSLITPEFLYYVLDKAKGFWHDSSRTE